MTKVMSTFPYEIFCELIGDGVLILLNGKIVYCNSIFPRWLGYSPTEIINIELSSLAILEDQPLVDTIAKLEIGKIALVVQHRFTLLSKNQSRNISVLANVSIVREGEWLGHIVVSLKNTTNEIMTEKLLNSSQQNLQEIIKTFPDIYYVTDAKGILIKVSPSVKTILGYEPNEVVGTPMIRYYKNPEMRDTIMAQVMAGKGQYVPVEAYLMHKSGRPVWFNTRARFLYDSDGNICGLEGLARDSTLEKQAKDIIYQREQELLEIKKNLESKVREQTQELLYKERLWMQKSRHEQMGEMISSIAHQWRQPLNVLSLWVNDLELQLKDEIVSPENLEIFTKKANSLIQSMSQTINEFRSFFKPLSEADIFNLGEAVHGVLKLVGSNLNQIKISFNNLSSDDIFVYGFANEFGQVMINLLTNVKESCLEKNIIQPKIDISLKIEANHVILEIADNAGGISKDIINKIFDPYFTTKEKGTGIGLYMSKNIVERHMQGEISVSNNDAGVIFKISLPISKKKSTDTKAISLINHKKNKSANQISQKKRLNKNEKYDFGHLRILFVDDNEDSRLIFSKVLQKKGAEVRIAASVVEALQILEKFAPNLLISDIQMPGEDGYALIQKIRSLVNTSINNIPAIALSAHVDDDEIQRALNLGFQKYFTKPADWQLLMNAILDLTAT